jgi:hypothetical protein
MHLLLLKIVSILGLPTAVKELGSAVLMSGEFICVQSAVLFGRGCLQLSALQLRLNP